MSIRVSCVAAALSLAFASNANADIVGSAYNFSASVTGNTAILATAGTHTDPANPGFCVGSTTIAPNCSGGSGVTGGFTFAMSSPTLDTITFGFAGSTAGAGPGSFTIDLGHFINLHGETILGITLASSTLGGATITDSWNGTDGLFHFSTTSDFNALGGANAIFNVQVASTPLPAALPLFVSGLGAMGLLGWRRKRKAVPASIFSSQ